MIGGKILALPTTWDEVQPLAPELVQARCCLGLRVGSVCRQWCKKVHGSLQGQGLSDSPRMPLVRVRALLLEMPWVLSACDPEGHRTQRIALTARGIAIASQILE